MLLNTLTISYIVSEILVENSDFSYRVVHNNICGKTVANIFALFSSQPSQMTRGVFNSSPVE